MRPPDGEGRPQPGIIDAVAYSLYGLAARKAAIRAAQAGSGVRPVELAQGIWLLPLSDAMQSADYGTGIRPYGDVFRGLTSEVEQLARRASRAGAVAYLEAEVFGGDGT